MKKITLFSLIIAFTFNTSFAEITGVKCKKTCEIERVVQKGAFLGVQIYKECGEGGVKVMRVEENSAASEFGIKLQDLILYVNDLQVNTPEQLVKVIGSYKPSDLITITYKREGKEYYKDIVLGAKSTKIVIDTICCDDDNDFFNDVNISLYPNPTTTDINLSMKQAQAGKYTFQIFDVLGKENYFQVENYETSFIKNINVENLNNGTYYLKITKGQSTFTEVFHVIK